MTKSTYLEQIAHKIDAHRQTIDALTREIDKLQGAAEVIMQLRGNDGVQSLPLDVTPDRRISGPITIAKIRDKPKRAAPDKDAAARARMRIIEVLDKNGPLLTAGIIAHMSDLDTTGKQRVYAMLTKMKDKGFLLRTDDGYYSLPDWPAGVPTSADTAQ